jgi:hypothetical protein
MQPIQVAQSLIKSDWYVTSFFVKNLLVRTFPAQDKGLYNQVCNGDYGFAV